MTTMNYPTKELEQRSRSELIEAVYELIKDLDEQELRELAAEVDRHLMARKAISEYVYDAAERQREQVEVWIQKAVRNYSTGALHAGR